MKDRYYKHSEATNVVWINMLDSEQKDRTENECNGDENSKMDVVEWLERIE